MMLLLVLGLLFFATPALCADYEILEKSTTVNVESSSFATEHHSMKIRILTEEGANFQEIQGVNGYIDIKNVTGSVISPAGKTTKIKSEHVMEVPISGFIEMISDYKALVISPPEVEKGSVIHIEYDRHVRSLLYLDAWEFATSVPISSARCSLTYPSTVPVKFRGQDDRVRIEKMESAGKTTIILQTQNRSPMLLHGDAEHFSNVERKVVFLPEQCMIEKWPLQTTSWPKIADWFSELSKFAYNSNSEMDSVVNGVLSAKKNPVEVADALYQYVQKNFAYTAVEVGIGGYKPRFAMHTFQKKYGDCKDLTMLYLALLRKAGIEGYPALVDTRSSKFFYENFPSPTQFNHCIAYLPKIQNGAWVDSTVKNFRLGEVPIMLQGKLALVAGGPNQLIKIPENFKESNVIRFRGTAKDVGTDLQVEGVIETQGLASGIVDSMRNALAKNAAKYQVHKSFLMSGAPVRNVDTSYDTERSLRLKFLTPVQQMGNYRLLLVNAIQYEPLEKMTIQPRADQYFALGSPLRLVVDFEIDLAGKKLISKPAEHVASGEYTQYRIEIRESQGKLRYLTDVYFANGFLTDSEMKNYQKELMQFASLLQRTVVIQ